VYLAKHPTEGAVAAAAAARSIGQSYSMLLRGALAVGGLPCSVGRMGAWACLVERVRADMSRRRQIGEEVSRQQERGVVDAAGSDFARGYAPHRPQRGIVAGRSAQTHHICEDGVDQTAGTCQQP
jgi:hypothetical protein